MIPCPDPLAPIRCSPAIPPPESPRARPTVGQLKALNDAHRSRLAAINQAQGAVNQLQRMEEAEYHRKLTALRNAIGNDPGPEPALAKAGALPPAERHDEATP